MTTCGACTLSRALLLDELAEATDVDHCFGETVACQLGAEQDLVARDQRSGIGGSRQRATRNLIHYRCVGVRSVWNEAPKERGVAATDVVQPAAHEDVALRRRVVNSGDLKRPDSGQLVEVKIAERSTLRSCEQYSDVRPGVRRVQKKGLYVEPRRIGEIGCNAAGRHLDPDPRCRKIEILRVREAADVHRGRKLAIAGDGNVTDDGPGSFRHLSRHVVPLLTEIGLGALIALGVPDRRPSTEVVAPPIRVVLGS
jgi:hypothetical protein